MFSFKLFFICASVVFALLSIGLGITDVIFGGIYYDSYTCDDARFSPTKWLVIAGSTRALTCILFLAYASGGNSLADLLTVFIAMFDIGWSVFGGVIFWHDCQDMTPDSLRQFMWVAVIGSCASVLGILWTTQRTRHMNDSFA